MLMYDYTAARKRCEERGMVFDERFLALADEQFTYAHLTQKQVDVVMCLHVHVNHWLWNPKNYTFKQRILIALHWLRGKAI